MTPLQQPTITTILVTNSQVELRKQRWTADFREELGAVLNNPVGGLATTQVTRSSLNVSGAEGKQMILLGDVSADVH